MMKGLSVSTPKTSRSKKAIRSVENITDFYEFGDDLMPSCHSGMRVIRAVQKSSGDAVVIKVRAKKNSFPNKHEEREWRNTTEMMLNFPDSRAIARLYEVLEDRKAYYVVMEKVQGLDLFESLMGNGPLSIDEVKEVLRQVLGGLEELHRHGAIHKDLKLENVMIDRAHVTTSSNSPNVGAGIRPGSAAGIHAVTVKLIDFDTVGSWTPKTPKAKNVLGTDQYISQEAYDGTYSPASDMFAVGVIGYKLLTGRFPFDSRIFNDEAGENWVGSPKMKEIREKVKTYGIDWNHPNFRREPQGADLVKSMLAADVAARPSARDALHHAWLRPPTSSTALPSRAPSLTAQSPSASFSDTPLAAPNTALARTASARLNEVTAPVEEPEVLSMEIPMLLPGSVVDDPA